MSVVEKVRACKTPRDALLVLAAEIDTVVARLDAPNEWDAAADWDAPPPLVPPGYTVPTLDDRGPDGLTAHEREQHRIALLAMSNTEARDVEVPPPAPEKMERRRMLERQQLKLADALGPDAGETDWTEAYARGGPWWLWQERRDLVMGYDFPTRQTMVADVEEDAPALAYEMSLDVLKHPATEPDLENGSGALAVGTVDGK